MAEDYFNAYLTFNSHIIRNKKVITLVAKELHNL